VEHDPELASMSGGPPRVTSMRPGVFQVEHDGRVETVYAVIAGNERWAFWKGRVFRTSHGGLRATGAPRGGTQGPWLTAPMPATVLKIFVAAGDAVRRGDTLIVLEAMKMELPLRASGDGVVQAVNCREGELVQPDSVLVHLA
jgi:3-methylcrotonyl-CoA carboxylase alpha subunit